MDRIRSRGLHRSLNVAVHLAWWLAAILSVYVSIFSHWYGIGAYNVPCSGDGCVSYFQLNAEQFAQIGKLGLTPELFGGLTVILLAIQNLSSWAVGFLLYRYGWKDIYCVTASLLLIVTGTIFSTDDMLFDDASLLKTGFIILNTFGSMYIFFLFLFPYGKFVPRWTMIPALVWVLIMVTSILLPVFPFLNSGLWPPLIRNAYMLTMHGLVVAAQFVRYFQTASVEQRRQIQWFAWGMACYSVGGVFGALEPVVDNGITRLICQCIMYSGLLFMPFSIGIVVLETRLRHMSIAFNRTLVYIVLSTMTVLFYAMIVGICGVMLQGKVNMVIALLATGLVAVMFHPLREKVQKAVNHLVYGERDDPYKVLSGLTERLESALTQRSLLSSIVENAAHALRLPYVAIEAQTERGTEKLASYGDNKYAAGQVSSIPLNVQGEPVGKLILGIDDLHGALPPDKRHLLDDLIRQVSIAVQAERLTSELHRSRERLVTAREEERRRLRRDLHDGLGSGLASMMLRLDEALLLHEAEPDKSRLALELVQAQMRAAIADIRRLVYALRPPALDEFGLAFAMQELAMQLEDPSMRVTLDGFDRGLQLHAAAEVALYRIAQEALTNAVRHAGASECVIRLRAEGDLLHVDITDNGCGLPQQPKPGIGIRSMRERAEELGGTFVIRSEPGQGTQISIQLPVLEGGDSHAGSGEAENLAG
ncbi:sensor histidine kinase [Paenibacillus sedimenti]|uniref:Oxygen sensor histidine kinase NreB n=1 Tax=Paenibacillus sedimenti TaxID=2770274 RepID=A0A926QM11_9BACL|nr:sensor histidine kinase [Paenibacillus sedimenti]MBD0383142.1 hypothetical protein [Paenibacillus sedimenti]